MFNIDKDESHLLPAEPTGKSLTERAAVPHPSLHVPNQRQEFIEEDQDGIDLLHLWHVILKRKWTIFTVFLIVTIAGTVSSFLATPIYQASLTINIEQEKPSIVDFQSVGQDNSRDWHFFQTQKELLKSRRLAEKVSAKLGLDNLGVVSGGSPLKQWVKDGLIHLGIKESTTDEELATTTDSSIENSAAMLLGGISVSQVQDSNIYSISYESPDPELATRVVNAWAEAFIESNIERRIDASSYARDFLQNRLQQFEEKLKESENQLLAFAREKKIINLDENRTITTQKLQDVNSALNAAEQERIKAESIFRQQGSSAQGLVQILDNPVIQQLKQAKAVLEAEYQENLKVFKPAYPKMTQLRSQIDQIQAKIDEETANVRSSIRATYEAAKSQEELLRARLEEVKEEVAVIQDRSVQYNILKREVDTNQQLYDDILQRLKEVGVATAVEANNISVVDRAQQPEFPYKPNHRRNVLLAMILGLFGGIALAFLFEHLDDTIKHPEDVERQLGIPVLGVIPVQTKEQHRAIQGKSLAFLTHDQPRSAFAEAYRSTRTALQFSTSDGTPRILLVTSALAGEGKSTTALSLAIQFAQSGKRVLIIDGDLRNPSLHRGLSLENNLGLTNYLAGSSQPSEIAKPTIVSNLFCISTGPLPPNPAELLSSAKMVSLLSLASDKFDQVIIDSPPVLGLADALILGNLAEGTLIAVHAGNTRRGYVQNALKRLKQARTHLIGGVLTKLDIQNNAYGYYYQSYYYYYNDEHSTIKERIA